MSEMTLRLVMKYLKQQNYCQSLVTLERQSQTKFQNYGKEIDFFRKILLRGDFAETAKFISTFEARVDERDYKKIMLELYRQKLYELIDNPDESELKVLFEKEVINYCTQQQYQNYFTYLTCRSVHDIPGLTEWTVIKGRLQCFQNILPYIDGVMSNVSQRDQVEGNLDQIVQAHLKTIGRGVQYSNLYKDQKVEQLQYAELGQNKSKASRIDKQDIHDERKPLITNSISKLSNPSVRSSRKLQQNHQLRPTYEIELQLSQSKVQKSQIPLVNKSYKPQITDKAERSHGPFDKRPRMYANLATNKSSKVDISRESDVDQRSSAEKHPKSEAFKVNPYQSSQIEQISDQQQKSQKSDVIKESKSYKYKKPTKYGKGEELSHQETLEQQVKKNIAYLEQNNSVVYKNQEENENFTFSNNADLEQKEHRVYKLGSISDSKAIRTCQYSQSGRYFALGTNSSYLKIFDVEELYEKNQPSSNLIPIYQIQGLHLKSIFSLDWSVNEHAIVTCSNDLTIRLTQFPEGMGSHRSNVIGKHQGCIRMVKFNSLENKVVSCDDKGLIKLWDIGKVHKCTDLKGHKDNGISAFKLSQTEGESILYSVGKDSVIKKWDIRTGDCEAISKKQDSQLTYIASNTEKIVVSHKNGNVSFFNSSLSLEHSVQIHQQEIRSIDGNSLDQSLLTASFDGHISMFNEQGTTLPFYHQHNEVEEDKVVFATFLQNPDFNGFASTSTLGICNIYSYD